MRRLAVILLCALALLSCSSGRERAVLRDARSLMNENPDSALVLLETIDRESLPPRLAAEYDRLDAQAFYNVYYFLDDAHASALAASYRFTEKSRERVGFMLLLIVAVLSTMVLYLWARKIQAEKLLLQEKTETEKFMSIAEDLQQRLSKASARDSSKMDMLERLCEQYYIYEGTDTLQPKILREVKSVIEGLRTDEKVQKSLEDGLNESCGGIMTRLREAFPKWKEEDFLLYTFVASGFSSTTIATLLEKDKPYVYNRIYRLKERIKAGDGPSRDEFLNVLGK